MGAAEVDFDDERDPSWGQPYRNGKVHVMSEQCSTCVFRPGNLMHLSPGRLKGMAEHVQETGVPFACHQTLSYASAEYQAHYDGEALCAGAVENYGDQSVVMRMAHAHNVIEHVEPHPGQPRERNQS